MSYYENDDENQQRNKDISDFAKKGRASKTKQKAQKWRTRGFKWFRKHESETEYNRNVNEMLRNE